MSCRRTLLHNPLSRHHPRLALVRRPLAAAAAAAAAAVALCHAHPPPRCQEAAEDPPAPLRRMATACPEQTHRPPLPPPPTPGRPQRWPNDAPCPCHAPPRLTLDLKRRKAAGGSMACARVQRLRLQPRSHTLPVAHAARSQKRYTWDADALAPLALDISLHTYTSTARTQWALGTMYIQCLVPKRPTINAKET